MTPTQELVEWALRHNIKIAKTPKMRKHYEERLDAFLQSVARRNPKTYNNPLARFEAALEK